MKKQLAAMLIASTSITYALLPPNIDPSNPLVAEIFSAVNRDNGAGQSDWATEDFHTILQDSHLYRVLLSLHVGLPNLARTGEYVLMLNEVHHLNENLELILKELQKLNAQRQ
ncbi:MAG: hypothetical protein NXI01_06925 [Gammaproteobacteria bacterium]|nr:hypothetical protein [Gammaproteobacteria bacterium]